MTHGVWSCALRSVLITMFQNLLHTDYGSGALYWAVSGYGRGVAMGGVWLWKGCGYWRVCGYGRGVAIGGCVGVVCARFNIACD